MNIFYDFEYVLLLFNYFNYLIASWCLWKARKFQKIINFIHKISICSTKFLNFKNVMGIQIFAIIVCYHENSLEVLKARFFKRKFDYSGRILLDFWIWTFPLKYRCYFQILWLFWNFKGIKISKDIFIVTWKKI